MNHSYFYLKHCEEGSAELDQLVFEDDLEDWRESTGEYDKEKEDEVMSWRRGDGLVDNGLNCKGKCQDEGLDARWLLGGMAGSPDENQWNCSNKDKNIAELMACEEQE